MAQDFGPIPKPQRDAAAAPTRSSRCRTASAASRCGAWAARRVCWRPTSVPAAHPDYAGRWRCWPTCWATRRRGRLHKRLVETQLAASTFGFSLALAEPGLLMLGAQLAPGQDVAARAQRCCWPRSTSLATEPITAEELERARTQWLNDWDEGFSDPEQVGVALSEAIGRATGGCTSCARDRMRDAEAGRRAARGHHAAAARQPHRGHLPADRRTAARAGAGSASTWRRWCKGYKGDAAAAQAEAFDATPANLDARTQLSALPGGLKLALLPKGTRGEVVTARLTLRFGDADQPARPGHGGGSAMARADRQGRRRHEPRSRSATLSTSCAPR